MRSVLYFIIYLCVCVRMNVLSYYSQVVLMIRIFFSFVMCTYVYVCVEVKIRHIRVTYKKMAEQPFRGQKLISIRSVTFFVSCNSHTIVSEERTKVHVHTRTYTHTCAYIHKTMTTTQSSGKKMYELCLQILALCQSDAPSSSSSSSCVCVCMCCTRWWCSSKYIMKIT